MSNHSKALVPLETWSYNSPEIRHQGKSLDMGLLAEALIYYDQVLLQITNQLQFAEFLQWFISKNNYSDILSLFNDETIKLYDYSFFTTAIKDEHTNSYAIWNIQDPTQEQSNSFEQRFLYHESLNPLFKNHRERKKLYKVLRDKVIEVKAKDFSDSIDNARLDYLDPRRNALVVQSFLDEVYPSLNLGTPPIVTAKIENLPSENRITYNLNFDQLSKLLGKDLNFNQGTPLTAFAHCNRLIWSAAQEKCDLYLGNPMASLVGDKFYESHLRSAKTKETISELNQEVEFPNIRKLVNEGKLDLNEILKIRKEAKKFRAWLQTESERDRNAIIAYHDEVAKEAGIVSLGRKILRMFGVLGIPIVEAHIATTYPETALITGSISAGAIYLTDVASKIGEGWKPVVFGDWVRDRIEKVLKEQE